MEQSRYSKGYKEGFKEGFREGELESSGIRSVEPGLATTTTTLPPTGLASTGAGLSTGLGTTTTTGLATTGATVIQSSETIPLPVTNIAPVTENPRELQPILSGFRPSTEIAPSMLGAPGIETREIITEKVIHPGDVQVKEHFVRHNPDVVNLPHIERHDVVHEVVHEIPHTIHHEVHHVVPHVVHHDVKHEVIEHERHKFVHDIKQDVHHAIEHDVKSDVAVSVEKRVVQEPGETVVCQESQIPHAVDEQAKVIVEPTTVVRAEPVIGQTAVLSKNIPAPPPVPSNEWLMGKPGAVPPAGYKGKYLGAAPGEIAQTTTTYTSSYTRP
eukprot:GEZU01039080.1.p1 GENE.GEZU01039080.1~~GEZU01039080.1.p1  ORF type:complete len:343 (-),score=92.75 GEZU01039080.1:201-1184(-)